MTKLEDGGAALERTLRFYQGAFTEANISGNELVEEWAWRKISETRALLTHRRETAKQE